MKDLIMVAKFSSKETYMTYYRNLPNQALTDLEIERLKWETQGRFVVLAKKAKEADLIQGLPSGLHSMSPMLASSEVCLKNHREKKGCGEEIYINTSKRLTSRFQIYV